MHKKLKVYIYNIKTKGFCARLGWVVEMGGKNKFTALSYLLDGGGNVLAFSSSNLFKLNDNNRIILTHAQYFLSSDFFFKEGPLKKYEQCCGQYNSAADERQNNFCLTHFVPTPSPARCRCSIL
jgi:hypothetical protein